VRDLLLTLAVALVLGLIVFGAVAFTLGKASGLDPASPDAAPHDLPQDSPVVAGDLSAVRFDVVPRGYRMDQVDGVLERLGYELLVRDEEIRVLREELVEFELLHQDGEEPTGAHAARPDPADAPAPAPAPADDDDTMVRRNDLVGQGVVERDVLDGDPSPGDPSPGDPALGDPALGDPALGDPALGDPAPGEPDGDHRAGSRALASDDTAVLGDLLGNDRHPR
jgi:DivIVA domain-containing protein